MLLIEDGKGDTLTTLELNEARMFQQALQFIIQIEQNIPHKLMSIRV